MLKADVERLPLKQAHERILALEAVMREAAHLAATLATAETGHARNRIMSVSNMLNAVMGRTQSSHGDQFDMLGQKIEI